MHMPTVLIKGQFRFYFYSSEPSRPHIHVKHSTGKEVLIWLDTLEIKKSCGSKLIDKRVLEEVKKELELLLDSWNEFFN